MKPYLYPIFVFNWSDFIKYWYYPYLPCLEVIDDFKFQGYVCYLYHWAWFCVMWY